MPIPQCDILQVDVKSSAEIVSQNKYYRTKGSKKITYGLKIFLKVQCFSKFSWRLQTPTFFWGKSNGDYSFWILLVDELVQDIAEKEC